MIKAKEWIIDYNSELNKKGPFYYANAQSNIKSVKEVTDYLINNNIKEIANYIDISKIKFNSNKELVNIII